jgi:hypothetical protein
MALGRSVLVNIREDAPEDNLFGAVLPVVRMDAECLRDDLRALAGDRERVARLGREGRAFVEATHDPRRVAASVLADLGDGGGP